MFYTTQLPDYIDHFGRREKTGPTPVQKKFLFKQNASKQRFTV